MESFKIQSSEQEFLASRTVEPTCTNLAGQTFFVPQPCTMGVHAVITISTDTLELLKELASDEDVESKEAYWDTNRVFGSICGIIFASPFGAVFSFNQLSHYGQGLCWVFFIFGGLGCAYCFFIERRDAKKRTSRRTRLISKINDLLKIVNCTSK